MKASILLTMALLLSTIPGPRSPYDASLLNPTGVTLRTQHAIYDDSCNYVLIYAENESDESLRYGTEWELEKLVRGVWRTVEPDINVSFTDLAIPLDAGSTNAFVCNLFAYADSLTDGEYRIVKDISGAYYTAEFLIGESPITVDTPHGFAPLEAIPKDYTSEAALADSCIVITADGIGNEAVLMEFLAFANVPRWRGQLRVVDFVSGTITDISRVDEEQFTRRRLTDDSVTEERYAYCRTADEQVLLTDARGERITPILKLPQKQS